MSPNARTAVAVLAALASACSVVHTLVGGGPPPSRPGSEPGTLAYTVGKLAFQAPASWQATGDARRVSAAHPDGAGRLEVRLSDRTFRDEAECLAQAEEALARGSTGASNVRRHPTTFAGRRGLAMEGDQGGWHGWAWALCDGGSQYRVSFFGATPLREEVMAAWRGLERSARWEADPR